MDTVFAFVLFVACFITLQILVAAWIIVNVLSDDPKADEAK